MFQLRGFSLSLVPEKKTSVENTDRTPCAKLSALHDTLLQQECA